MLVLGHAVLLGEQAARIAVHLFDEQAVSGDFGLDVAVSRAGNGHAERAGCAVAGQADDADVVGKVFTAELGTDAEVLGCLLQFLFQLDITEGLAVIIADRWQIVELLGSCQLDGLHDCVGRGAADDEGEVVRGTGCGAESFHLGDQVVKELLRGEQRLGLLEEHGLVGGAAAFCHEQELVGVALCGVKVDLRRQVGAGVLLFVHIEGNGLAVAQVLFGVGLEDPFGNIFGIVNTGPDLLTLLGNDSRRSGVLAGRQFELSRNHGVAQECHRDALVVTGGFGIHQNLGDLLVMLLAQQKGDVLHGCVGQDGQCFRINLENVLAVKVVGGDILLRTFNLVIAGFVCLNGKRVLVKNSGMISLLYNVNKYIPRED